MRELSTCGTCRRRIDQQAGARLAWLRAPDYCAWCGRARSAAAKKLGEKIARQFIAIQQPTLPGRRRMPVHADANEGA